MGAARRDLSSTATKTKVKYYDGFSIKTTETVKTWKDADGAVLKEETIRKRTDKKSDFTLATNEIENTFDGQGKKTLTIETKQARVPDLNNYPARALQTTAENRTEYTYAADPRNLAPRRAARSRHLRKEADCHRC